MVQLGFDSELICTVCNSEYNRLIAIIKVAANDNYETTRFDIDIDEERFKLNVGVRYNFRSQGNVHLLYSCDSGHYHFISFDGHKGRVFANRNELFSNMASHLNKVDSDFEHLNRFHLIGEIEAFLNSLKKEKSI
ncbi:hypothetical protein KQ41_06555 [Lysinibacillus fusiformis]|uniref:hypothetical protein n=1 Tax=Lysinibacillus fusiformis TaxID=28031 RepID=UPI000501294F|nr:hypothetical protein [Lysinibacillus fusiformis]KGA83696.1 hypothetical protein KQ41_06555 [Lysinibacillus fusiformis]